MSISTEKLEVVCGMIKERILSDDKLKDRVTKIKITWDTEGSWNDEVIVPNLEIEFKN